MAQTEVEWTHRGLDLLEQLESEDVPPEPSN